MRAFKSLIFTHCATAIDDNFILFEYVDSEGRFRVQEITTIGL